MKPLIYGYMRVEGDEPDGDLRQMEQTLWFVAEQGDYCFATTFHEFEPEGRRYGAWRELIEELQRAEAHHVIVPTFDHISPHAILREHLILQLRYDASAQVLSLDDCMATRCDAHTRPRRAVPGMVPDPPRPGSLERPARTSRALRSSSSCSASPTAAGPGGSPGDRRGSRWWRGVDQCG